MKNKEDSTKWNYWYLGLIAALLIQIVIYLMITNYYAI